MGSSPNRKQHFFLEFEMETTLPSTYAIFMAQRNAYAISGKQKEKGLVSSPGFSE